MTDVSRTFRQDINGLRAIAVLMVVFFHFGVAGFGGGFAGVDVFFVISGFLMTQIAVNGLNGEHNRKSIGSFLARFYLARARRIIPALLFFCLALLVFGWFFLTVSDYQDTARQISRAAFFRSNFSFAQEAGYFSKNAHDQLLLHTWSLAVEWQFYVIFPILLGAAKMLGAGKRAILGLIVLLFLASFAWGLREVIHSPLRAFYLLPSRSWELLAGGLVFFLPSVKSAGAQRVLTYGGLILIILSSLLLSNVGEGSWPGWKALLPVVGACLVLAAAQAHAFWSRSNFVQWVGNISYSFYLWHWPFAVVMGWLSLKEDYRFLLLSLVSAMVLAHISWRWIEQPGRQYMQGQLNKTNFLVLLSATLLVTGLAGWIKRTGIPVRLPDEVIALAKAAKDTNPRMLECMVTGVSQVPECAYGGKQLGAIVLGDSHAASIVRSVEKALPEKNLHVLDWTRASCPTMFDLVSEEIEGAEHSCHEFLKYALEKSAELPDAPLIILNRSGSYFHGPNEEGREGEVAIPKLYVGGPYHERSPEFFRRMKESMIKTACLFQKTRQVYLVRPIPEMKWNVPDIMSRYMMFGIEKHIVTSVEEYNKRQRLAMEAQDEAAEICGVKILDPVPYLCDQQLCYGDKGGKVLYYDDDHLSESGAALLLPLFKGIFSAH